MKTKPAVIILACALAGVALAQNPPSGNEQAPAPGKSPAPAALAQNPPPGNEQAPAPGKSPAPAALAQNPPSGSGSTPAPGTSQAPAVLAQNPPSGNEQAPAPGTSQAPAAPASPQAGALEVAPDTDTLDVHVQRRVDEFEHRRQKREQDMAAFDKAKAADPALARYADLKKVAVELSDELDREQTSEGLANDYAGCSSKLETTAQALAQLIAKRRQELDGLTAAQPGTASRQNLETALANLAKLPDSPETQAQMRDLDQQLSQLDFNEKQLPARRNQVQHELADATEVLTRTKAGEQSCDKQAATYRTDAREARENRLRLADKIDTYSAISQAEDELEQGGKALEAAKHLGASSHTQNALNGAPPSSRSAADLQQLKDCIKQTGDVPGCRAKLPPQREE